MNIINSLQVMAKYNQRINAQLLDVCKQLNDEQLNCDTGAFFPSVMAHWNHILFGDLIMMQRLRNSGFIVLDSQVAEQLPCAAAVDDQFVTSLTELHNLRILVDNIYIDFTESLSEQDCRRQVNYQTTEGQTMSRNLAAFCQHLFNHQTHHRGQLSCLLSQFGLDYGCMDLPVVVPDTDL